MQLEIDVASLTATTLAALYLAVAGDGRWQPRLAAALVVLGLLEVALTLGWLRVPALPGLAVILEVASLAIMLELLLMARRKDAVVAATIGLVGIVQAVAHGLGWLG